MWRSSLYTSIKIPTNICRVFKTTVPECLENNLQWRISPMCLGKHTFPLAKCETVRPKDKTRIQPRSTYKLYSKADYRVPVEWFILLGFGYLPYVLSQADRKYRFAFMHLKIALIEPNALIKILGLHAIQSAQVTPIHAKELKPVNLLVVSKYASNNIPLEE